MAYVVKAMCYVDSEGYGVPDLKKAKRYNTKEMAELAAYVSKYFYDQLILQGFNEGQAMEFMMRTFSANNQQKE